MATVVRFRNSFGTTQIDAGWRNYGFQSKQTATITAYLTSPPNPAGYNGMTYQMTASGTDVLIACRALTLMPVLLHTYASGGTWTYNWLFVPPGASPVTETVTFYIFDLLTGPFGPVGLRLKKPTGELTFHSDSRPMQVGAIQGCDTAFTGTAGHIYAPLITRSPVFGVSMGFPIGYRLWSHCLRGSGNSIISNTSGPLGAFGASGSYSNAGQYAALDVTGL